MLEGRVNLFLFFILFVSHFNLFSQEIKVEGGFVNDSMVIGQNVNYWLTVTYPKDIEVQLPSRHFQYFPFEFTDKVYFKTQLKNNHLFDSAVYTLQSFEIELVQYLRLPAIMVAGKDSAFAFSLADSIYLKELAPMISDTTQLLSNANYLLVMEEFNYPLLFYILGATITIILIFLALYFKRIVKYLKLRRLKKLHEYFTDTISNYILDLKTNPSFQMVNEATLVWKRYQSKLEKEHFTTLTSKEILSIDYSKSLEKPLIEIDKVIYGKQMSENIYQDFQLIEDFVQDRYLKKVEDIKNG